mmetsp:Transcript_1832/g.2407  ORF Transcript_1832/g.2407 Transcript_1832/m.2407 type:complete len:209 (+) Transcript_1832:93-719(+)
MRRKLLFIIIITTRSGDRVSIISKGGRGAGATTYPATTTYYPLLAQKNPATHHPFSLLSFLVVCLHDHGRAGEHPLGGGRLGLHGGQEDVGWPAEAGQVHGALVHVGRVPQVAHGRGLPAGLHLHGLHIDHGQQRQQLLQPRVREHPARGDVAHRLRGLELVQGGPARALDVDPVDEHAVVRHEVDACRVVVGGDVRLSGHLVQGEAA